MTQRHRLARLEGDPHRVEYEAKEFDGGYVLDPVRQKSTGGAWVVPEDEVYTCECGAEFEERDAALEHLVEVNSDENIYRAVWREMYRLCRDVRWIKQQMIHRDEPHDMSLKDVIQNEEDNVEWSINEAELIAAHGIEKTLWSMYHNPDSEWPSPEIGPDTRNREELLEAIGQGVVYG